MKLAQLLRHDHLNLEKEDVKKELGNRGGVVFAGIVSYFVFQPSSNSMRVNATLKAELTRPTEISDRVEQISISFEGGDILSEFLNIQCGKEIQPDVSMPRFHDERVVYTLVIIPRAVDCVDRDFQSVDFRVDREIPLVFKSPHLVSPVADSFMFRLKPGEYRVRYYLKTRFLDLEEEKLPVQEFLGENKLQILPGENGAECDRVPLEGNFVPAEYFD